MQPLAALPPGAWRDVGGVFTDIDDTLTTEGAITPGALTALQALRDGGVRVIAVTGRPVGWSEPFALSWPMDAIVAENGAVALIGPHGPTVAVDAINDQNSLQRPPRQRQKLSTQ